MLKQIVQIKSYRLDAAEREVAKAKRALLEQQQLLEEHKKLVADFRLFMVEEKRRLFQKIENLAIGLAKVNEYKDDVAELKETLILKEQKTTELEDLLLQAEKRVTQARLQYQKRYAELQKYQELMEEIGENEQYLELRKEEVEQEDLVASLLLRSSVRA